jgi:hypothetical protein
MDHGPLSFVHLRPLPGRGLDDAGRHGGEAPADVPEIAPDRGVPPRKSVPVHTGGQHPTRGGRISRRPGGSH